MFGLYNKKLLETYIEGLRRYIRIELNMHDILNVEVASLKEKVAEVKLKGRSKARFEKSYLQEK